MPYVVVDTHVFIRSLTPGAEYREVMDTIVRVRDSIVINRPIISEYQAQAQRNHIPGDLLQRVLLGQESSASVQFVNASGDLRRWEVPGIPNQDQRFVVAYRASHAEYLISEDPDFQSQRQRLLRLRPPIQVVYPQEYVSIRARASNI